MQHNKHFTRSLTTRTLAARMVAILMVGTVAVEVMKKQNFLVVRISTLYTSRQRTRIIQWSTGALPDKECGIE